MPWNLLLIPLAAGYFILTRLNRFRYKQQRLDRQRLLFDSILLGLLTIGITFCIRSVIEIIFPASIDWVYQFLPIKQPYTGTILATILIAVLSTNILNKTIYRDRTKCIISSIEKVGNEQEILFKRSGVEKKLLEITLSNGKFYIGIITELPVPSISNYIKIQPWFSGYRDDEKKLVFTTDYTSVYQGYIDRGEIANIDELDVDLVIPISNIHTSSVFDLEMFDRFNDVTKR